MDKAKIKNDDVRSVNVMMPKALHEKAAKIAEATDRSLSAVARLALAEYVSKAGAR